VKSRAVAERCGFTLEGVLRCEALGVDGHPRDTAVYARIA
jgi:RimJ/RimL family protein N-acetyltransferase